MPVDDRVIALLRGATTPTVAQEASPLDVGLNAATIFERGLGTVVPLVDSKGGSGAKMSEYEV